MIKILWLQTVRDEKTWYLFSYKHINFRQMERVRRDQSKNWMIHYQASKRNDWFPKFYVKRRNVSVLILLQTITSLLKTWKKKKLILQCLKEKHAQNCLAKQTFWNVHLKQQQKNIQDLTEMTLMDMIGYVTNLRKIYLRVTCNHTNNI